MNEVRYLKNKYLCYEDRLLAKTLGPPRPDLCIIQSCQYKNMTSNRTFKKSTYEKYEWICGCPVVNAFFCFPCLLFGGDFTWIKIGVKDLKHLAEKAKKHALSKSHLDNEMSLALLGRIHIRQQLDDGYRVSVREHNELVDKNRYILSRIIDAVKFCGEFELSLRGHDKTEDSNNPGVFKGLINYTSTIDSVLKDHLESASVFKGTSKTIQNELLDAMLSVCQENISSEISEVDFLSIQADEATDSSCKTQMVLILRYQIDGNIHERFWGFFEMNDRSASGLAETIFEQLSELGVDKCPEKLICQTYNGASLMRGSKGGVQCLVREKYPNANYIHCYAHQGNLILQNATSSTQSRIFFHDIQGIGPFFAESHNRMECFIEFVQRHIVCAPPTRWYFQHRTVNAVYENKDSLIECFEHVRDTEIEDIHACTQAAGFVRTLKDPQFLFWLTFYHEIMPHVAVFFDSIQQINIDSTKVKEFYEHFRNAVVNVRKMYEQDNAPTGEPTNKRRCVDIENSTSNRTAAIEVCDTIIDNITDRFVFSDHLCASKLFCVKNFEQYSTKFPESDFQSTLLSYPTVNSQKLRTELEVLYSRTDLRAASGATPLLQFFLENNMSCTFSECVTVLKIIVTIPMTTLERERCFSTLSRIKTFLRNTMGAERLTALAMLSLEKRMINCIPEFNKRVIEKFAQSKERRVELVYRHLNIR